MGSTISKIGDEIRLHGSWDNYLAWDNEQYKTWAHTEPPKSLQKKPVAVKAVVIKKPPLGVMPYGLWLVNRFDEVNAAIARYAAAGWEINPDWIKEREWLHEQFKTLKAANV